MRYIERNIDRKVVVEFYVNLEGTKKNLTTPDFTECNWDDPNDIDARLQAVNGYKYGIISGYKTWDLVEMNLDDLLQSAIVDQIFPQHSQVLRNLVDKPDFMNWKTDRKTEWYDHLESGLSFKREWSMVLRPTVTVEKPAKWYIEDGSGRAVCFTRHLWNNKDCQSFAYGYLGYEVDPDSRFMNSKFPSLLKVD